jgi:CRISPR system Cascade subunit CasD
VSVLALRLAGPLQAWGAASRFARRGTENAPTKSGVLGLLAAAQGRPRGAELSDLAALGFGVRIDQPGVCIRDYQTAHHQVSGASMPVSERFYLADAVFVAVVAGEDALVGELAEALRRPVFLPYLGRRSCPPSRRVDLQVYEGTDLVDVLRQVPWQASKRTMRRRRRETVVELQAFVDAEPGDAAADIQRDVPLSFDPGHRRYGLDVRAIRQFEGRVVDEVVQGDLVVLSCGALLNNLRHP